jgi:hypothetical protein
LKQGLGAGLLNVSNVAQEALPTAIQGGFGSGALAGFLGSLGGPARQAVSQEEERQKIRRQVQLSFLQEAFPKLTGGSKQAVLQKLGVDLGGLQFQETPAEASIVTKELVNRFGEMMSNPKLTKEERSSAFGMLKQLDPEIGEAIGQFGFADAVPEEDDMHFLASEIFRENTAETANRFYDKKRPEFYLRFDKLVPKPKEEGGSTETVAKQLQLQGVSDYGHVQKLAQERGISVDQAADIFFQGDKARRANYENTMHISAGSTPPSEADRIGSMAKELVKSGIMKDVGDVVPESVRILDEIDRQAKQRAQQTGSIALPGQKAGARNPAGIAAPLPAGTAPFQAPPATFGGPVPQGSPFAAPPAVAPFPGPVAPPQVAPALTPKAIPVPPKLTEGLTGKAASQTTALYQAATAAGIDLKGVTNSTTLMAKLKALPLDQRTAILQAAQSTLGLTD